MLNDLITNGLGGIIGAILYILITKGKKYSIYNILLSIFILIEIVVVGYLIVGFISNFSTYIELLSQIL